MVKETITVAGKGQKRRIEHKVDGVVVERIPYHKKTSNLKIAKMRYMDTGSIKRKHKMYIVTKKGKMSYREVERIGATKPTGKADSYQAQAQVTLQINGRIKTFVARSGKVPNDYPVKDATQEAVENCFLQISEYRFKARDANIKLGDKITDDFGIDIQHSLVEYI